jgi:hypothetical protein
MRLASRMLFLHATGGKYSAKPPVFESTLSGQLFELKNEETIKKSETYVLARAYPSTLCMARSYLVRQFQKNPINF